MLFLLSVKMSCLFDSLASLLGTSARALRGTVCDYLDTDPYLGGLRASKVIDEGLRLREYVREMRRESTWGGATEIKAVCNLHHVNVTVIITSTGRQIQFQCTGEPRRTIYVNWANRHYTPGRRPLLAAT